MTVVRSTMQVCTILLTSLHEVMAMWRRPYPGFQNGGIEVPQAPMVVGRGEGYPPVHWGKGLSPSSDFFCIFC